jgi:hypothetical protein
MVRCANCGGSHKTAREARECFNTPLPTRSASTTQVQGVSGPTERQKAYIADLVRQTGVTLDKPLNQYSVVEASRLIEKLLERRRTTPARNGQQGTAGTQGRRVSRDQVHQPIEDGMYRMQDGTIYKVQHAVHGSGRQYAKKLVVVQEPERDDEGDIVNPGTIKFVYISGAIWAIRSEHRMTIEQAKEFGALYGTCVRCGRTLTKEKSIERAMGPVCAGKI